MDVLHMHNTLQQEPDFQFQANLRRSPPRVIPTGHARPAVNDSQLRSLAFTTPPVAAYPTSEQDRMGPL